MDASQNIYVGPYAGVGEDNIIRKWNGSSWSTLGSALNGDIYGIIKDSSGSIYVAGNMYFDTTHGIVKWGRK